PGPHWLREAFHGPDLVDRAAYVSHRNHLESGARHVAHSSSLRQHVRQRPAYSGLLFAGSHWNSDYFSGIAFRRRADSSVCLHAAGNDLSGRSHRSTRCPLNSFASGVLLPLRHSGRKREGASTVSLNHPLTAHFEGSKEKYKCANCNISS